MASDGIVVAVPMYLFTGISTNLPSEVAVGEMICTLGVWAAAESKSRQKSADSRLR